MLVEAVLEVVDPAAGKSLVVGRQLGYSLAQIAQAADSNYGTSIDGVHFACSHLGRFCLCTREAAMPNRPMITLMEVAKLGKPNLSLRSYLDILYGPRHVASYPLFTFSRLRLHFFDNQPQSYSLETSLKIQRENRIPIRPPWMQISAP